MFWDTRRQAQLRAALVSMLLLAAVSCSGGAVQPGSENGPAAGALLSAHDKAAPVIFSDADAPARPPLIGGLPALPGPGALPARETSWQEILFVKGNSIFDSSGGIIFAGDSAVLSPGQGELDWTLYPFSTGGYQPERVEVGLSCGAGSTAWVALSNYERGAWEFHGPYTDDAVINLTSNSYVNMSNQFFLAVVAYDTATVSVNYGLMSFENGVPAQFGISGTVTDENGDPVPGIAVREGTNFDSAVTNLQGEYFLGLAAGGSYDLEPDLNPTDYNNNTGTLSVTVDGQESGQDFTLSRIDIRGRLTTAQGVPIVGAELTLLPDNRTAKSNSEGYYEFRKVNNGNYTVSALLATYSFTPDNQPVMVNGADEDNIDFEGSGGQPVFGITGNITDSGMGPVEGVFVSLSPGSRQTTTDANGNYSFVGLPAGTYNVKPVLGLWSFTPGTRLVNLSGSSENGIDFEADPPPPTFRIYGTVQDSSFSFTGIPYCSLQLKRASDGVILAYRETDVNGDFEFPEQPNGSYKVLVSDFSYNNIELGFTVSSADVPLTIATTFASDGVPTYDNFIAEYTSEWCLPCHRPDSGTAVDPYLRTYDETKNAGSACNFDIQNDVMPPGHANYPLHKLYWQAWKDAGYPENEDDLP
ncbi:carboxypeptidase regulatory-like domain-containing protein [bacterium]|nr:carboxypeptidase regulatory-like domain-containing protein [bacterium]